MGHVIILNLKLIVSAPMMIFQMRCHIGCDFSLIGHFGQADFTDGEACAVSRTLSVLQVAEVFPDARPDSVFRRIKLGQFSGSSDSERVDFSLQHRNQSSRNVLYSLEMNASGEILYLHFGVDTAVVLFKVLHHIRRRFSFGNQLP